MRHMAIPYALSTGAGFLACLLVTAVSGRKEAWDSTLYFVAAIPAMCVAILALSCAWPVKAWRWVFAMAVGQSIALLMGGGSLSLWPLAIVAMTVLSLPQLAVAIVTSRVVLGRRGADG
jgi:hypothetical protein